MIRASAGESRQEGGMEATPVFDEPRAVRCRLVENRGSPKAGPTAACFGGARAVC
jgi:hypothetical protein